MAQLVANLAFRIWVASVVVLILQRLRSVVRTARPPEPSNFDPQQFK